MFSVTDTFETKIKIYFIIYEIPVICGKVY